MWPTAKIAAFSDSRPTANSSTSGPTWLGLATCSSIAAGRIFVAEIGFRAGMYYGIVPPNASGGRMSIFSPQGELLARWGGGANPCAPGDFLAPHDVWIDSRGDFYVGEVNYTTGIRPGLVGPDSHTLQKFTVVST